MSFSICLSSEEKTMAESYATPLDDFSEYMPEAEVYQYLLCDMDNNGGDSCYLPYALQGDL